MRRWLVLFVTIAAACWYWRREPAISAAPPVMASQALAGGGTMTVAAVGHEFRQDDLPAITAAPDGSLWAAWLSFVGDRDDIAIRQYANGRWGNLQWVPNTSGDSWLPQIAVDAANGVWVVWSQQAGSNWDLYARRFDPGRQEWGALQRLTSDPLPDINPRLTSDGKGRFALVWQGFRGRNSNIFLKMFDGERWSVDTRVTNRAVNDWEPAVALDPQGTAWVAYDSYRNGNYDIFLTQAQNGKIQGEEITITATPRFEARPTVAIDSGGRVWIAWEAGSPNWGKDQGYILRGRAPGVPLGGVREPQIACYANGQLRETPTAPASAFEGNTYQPHVFADGRGSIWVVAASRGQIPVPGGRPGQNRGYWEYRATHLEGGAWSKAFALPNSRGRSSVRVNAALASDGALWLAWPTDGRNEGFFHRPIRQQVFAGKLPVAAVEAPVLREPSRPGVQAAQGHADEAGDIRALRAHVAAVGTQKLRIVRGDFHRHTELSWDGGGGADGSLQDFYRYMIDAASMDFGASTDHQGGAWPYWWWYTQKMTDMHHVPGAYTAIYGYERSVTFPNGHRNVFFARRSDSRVTPFYMQKGVEQFSFPLSPMGDDPGIGTGAVVENDTKMLYEEMRERNALAISHTSGTRMGTDWRNNDPDLEPVVEIYQGARTNYESLEAPHVAEPSKDGPHIKQAGYQPEGMVSNAWTKGYKLGIIASSDHGSTHISYAMVYTDDPTRQGILDAIRKRHTYGAMDNIILDVRMGAHFMGDEFRLAKPLPIRVNARGTRPIARVVFIKDNKVVHTATPGSQTVQSEFTDRESAGGRHFYYVRVEQEDGMLAWSSPFFVNYQ